MILPRESARPTAPKVQQFGNTADMNVGGARFRD